MHIFHSGILGWSHLIYFGIALPLAAIRTRHKHLVQRRSLANGIQNFRSMAISLLLFAAFSIVIACRESIAILPPVVPSWTATLAGIAMYLVAVEVMRPYWREGVQRRSRIAALFMPSTAAERAWWIVVSVLAGVSEEITWRCVQVALLTQITGYYGLAAVVSAISFALAHSIQGWRSVLIITGFALGFQLLFWLAESLYVAMAVHIAYDITAGLTYGRLGRKFSHPTDQIESSGGDG